MATHPIPTVSAQAEIAERPLTREEAWQLCRNMRGILKESYAKLGGAEEYHRKERESWDESSDQA